MSEGSDNNCYCVLEIVGICLPSQENVTEGGGPWIMVTTFAATNRQVIVARDDEGRLRQ